MHRKHRTSFLIATFMALAALAPVQALMVSPGRTQARLAPGARIKTVLKVSNEGAEKLQIEIATKDWFVLDVNKKIPLDQWLTIRGKKQFWLKPGKSRKIPVTLFCPKEAQGELVGMVSFIHRTAQPSMVTPVISVSMYLSAAGTEKISGEITEVNLFTWKDKLQAAAVVKSTGNVHLRPSGRITLTDDQGRQVGDFPVPEADPAYPGQVRGYMSQVPADFKLVPGHYAAKAELAHGDLRMTAVRGVTVLADGQMKMDEVQK